MKGERELDEYYHITLVDDENKEHDFEILDIVENEDGKFYALLPSFEKESLEDETSGEDFYSYYVFKSIKEGDEEKLLEVFDDTLLEKIGEIFESRFKKFYEEAIKETNSDG